MGYIDNLDYQKTKRKKRIVLKSKWLDFMDSILFFMISASFIICQILIVMETYLKNPNDNLIIYWCFPFFTIFIFFAVYKKITEKRLLIIETNLEKTASRKQILILIKSWGWEIHKDNANYLQATTGIDVTWGKQIIVIYDNQKIYLNVMSDNPKVRMPILFSDKSIKKTIEKGLTAIH